jgi:predicted ester cyclase
VNYEQITAFYHRYIACLNHQDWPKLECFVGADVTYNGSPVGLRGYRAMLQKDFLEIPDLRFNIQLLICDPPYVVSRLAFNCSPVGNFLGLPVNGRTIQFSENVIYETRNGRMSNVWSVIDKSAIESQLARHRCSIY